MKSILGTILVIGFMATIGFAQQPTICPTTIMGYILDIGDGMAKQMKMVLITILNVIPIGGVVNGITRIFIVPTPRPQVSLGIIN